MFCLLQKHAKSQKIRENKNCIYKKKWRRLLLLASLYFPFIIILFYTKQESISWWCWCWNYCLFYKANRQKKSHYNFLLVFPSTSSVQYPIVIGTNNNIVTPPISQAQLQPPPPPQPQQQNSSLPPPNQINSAASAMANLVSITETLPSGSPRNGPSPGPPGPPRSASRGSQHSPNSSGTHTISYNWRKRFCNWISSLF